MRIIKLDRSNVDAEQIRRRDEIIAKQQRAIQRKNNNLTRQFRKQQEKIQFQYNQRFRFEVVYMNLGINPYPCSSCQGLKSIKSFPYAIYHFLPSYLQERCKKCWRGKMYGKKLIQKSLKFSTYEKIKWYYQKKYQVYTAVRRRNRIFEPKWADKTAIRAVYKQARDLTDATGIIHEVDHIVPLRSRVVCGLHVEHNLRVIPKDENRSKANKFIPG